MSMLISRGLTGGYRFIGKMNQLLFRYQRRNVFCRSSFANLRSLVYRKDEPVLVQISKEEAFSADPYLQILGHLSASTASPHPP